MPSEASAALAPPLTWFGWPVPTLVEVAVVAVLGLVMTGVAIWEFSSTE
jgi:ABC-2 type transport system permease protein